MRRGLLLTAPAVLVGILVGTGPRRLHWAVAIAIGLASIAAIIVTLRGLDDLLGAVMVATALLVPMNGLRVGELMTVSDVFLLAAIPLIAMRSLMQEAIHSWPYRPFISSLAIIGYGGLVASWASAHPGAGLPSLLRFTISTVVVVFLVALWRPDLGSVRSMLWAYAAGSAASVAVGLISGGYGLSGRATGLSVHPNHFGLICLFACGGATALALEARTGRARLAACGLACVQVAGIVVSGSRGAVLGLAVGVLAFVAAAASWQVFRRLAGLTVLLVIGAIAASSILPEVNAIDRLTGGDRTTAQSNQERQVAVDSAVRQIGESPILGSGFEFALVAHSLYLQIWASAGLIGLAGLARLAWWSLRTLWRNRRDPFGSALIATFIGYLGTGTTSTVLWDRYVWLFLGISLAAATAARRRREPASLWRGTMNLAPRTRERQLARVQLFRMPGSQHP